MDAVIDIGSNSVRLMLDSQVDGLNRKQLITTRLGEGGNRLTDASMARTLAAIDELYAQAVAAGAAHTYVFATEAVRSAENGRDFAAAIRAKTGLPVDILDAETEAVIGYRGATIGLAGALAVIDIGGASTEIAVGIGQTIARAASIPIGAVRLKTAAGNDFDAMQKTVDTLLDRLPDPSHAQTVVAIGGTATALASADLRLQEYRPARVHRHRLTADAVTALLADFTRGGDLVKRFPALSEKRAQIILQGAFIFHRIFDRFHLSSVTVSETDNCEGYLQYRNGKR